MNKKPIVWMGSSRADLAVMPEAVRKDFGGALHAVQEGRAPEQSKILKGKVKGAIQLSEDHDGNSYRAIYMVELEGVIYVLHCFQKKSTSGVATPQVDLDRIESRMKAARVVHARRKEASA